MIGRGEERLTRPFATADDTLVRLGSLTAVWSVPVSDDVEEALGTLGWRAEPSDVGCAAAPFVVVAVLSLPLAAVVPLVGMTVAAYATVAALAVLQTPAFALALYESRLVGAGPGLVARLALRVRIEPSAEAAARFAARTGDGPLARALAGCVRSTAGTPETPLDTFEAVLPTPGLRRAVTLVGAAVETPASDRVRVLDRALDAAHDATDRHVRAGTGAVRGPVNGVYAFGVVLPLALVGLVPVAPTAGVSLPTGVVAVTYDVFLPLALLLAAAWVLAHRPAVFPAGRAAGPDHAERRMATLGGVGAGAAAGVGCVVLSVPWAAVVAVPCCGLGVALAVASRTAVETDERVTALEEGLPAATALVGRRLAAGDPPEDAVAAVGATLSGPVGDLFGAADRTRRALGRPVEAAFFGRHGVFGPTHGARVRGTVRLVVAAATGGTAGGRVLVEVADGLDGVRRLEADARADLADLADTLARTGSVFAPVVAGVTVALASHVGGVGGSTGLGAGVSTATLGVVVGGYVAWSAVVLTGLAVCLDRGVRPALLAYRIGVALASAGACYATAAAAAGLLL